MRKNELLPGVSPRKSPPDVRCDARETIRAARMKAALQELMQVAFLLLIDAMFVYWPESRVPFLDRGETLTLLRIANIVILADLLLTRLMPQIRARRVATTWSDAERKLIRY